MHTAITRPPRTIMEVYQQLPEGTLAELIDGIIYMSPSPVERHQRIISLLSSKMILFTEENDLGRVYVAPFDVYLDEHSNAVQPDILFIAKENLSIVKGHVHGVPDLIVEILSEGNSQHDTVRKKNLYEKFKVKEYWIVDPQTKAAMGYQLERNSYVALPAGKSVIHSPLLGGSFVF